MPSVFSAGVRKCAKQWGVVLFDKYITIEGGPFGFCCFSIFVESSLWTPSYKPVEGPGCAQIMKENNPEMMSKLILMLPGPIWYQSRFFSHRSGQHLGIIEFYCAQRLHGQKAYKGVEKAKGVQRLKKRPKKRPKKGEHCTYNYRTMSNF